MKIALAVLGGMVLMLVMVVVVTVVTALWLDHDRR